MSKWVKDAPDHWHRRVDDEATVAVWPRGMPVRDWVWEVFDFNADPDEPIVSGSAPSFSAAKKAADAAWDNLR